jgi:hypothetical protein
MKRLNKFIEEINEILYKVIPWFCTGWLFSEALHYFFSI